MGNESGSTTAIRFDSRENDTAVLPALDVTITSPLDGDAVVENSTILVQADATDDVAVSQV